jgi:hypothetical protein
MTVRDYNAAVDFVDRNVAEGRGDKTAFIDPSRNLTYAELRDAAARIGPMLTRLGIEKENRIAIVLLDTVEFPILFWGAIRAGIVPVLLNTRITVDEYRYLLEDSRSKAVFVSAALLPLIEEAAAGLPDLKKIVVVGGGPASKLRLDTLLAAENEGSAPARTCADDVAYWRRRPRWQFGRNRLFRREGRPDRLQQRTGPRDGALFDQCELRVSRAYRNPDVDGFAGEPFGGVQARHSDAAVRPACRRRQ